MTNTQIKKLLSLSRNEKLRIVHTLWDNIAKDKANNDMFPEHIAILDKRLKKIKNGKSKFKNWESIKSKYIEKP
jgi:putative addiction module component (TIGR02574 family)